MSAAVLAAMCEAPAIGLTLNRMPGPDLRKR